jgi:hypothetical protein
MEDNVLLLVYKPTHARRPEIIYIGLINWNLILGRLSITYIFGYIFAYVKEESVICIRFGVRDKLVNSFFIQFMPTKCTNGET